MSLKDLDCNWQLIILIALSVLSFVTLIIIDNFTTFECKDGIKEKYEVSFEYSNVTVQHIETNTYLSCDDAKSEFVNYADQVSIVYSNDSDASGIILIKTRDIALDCQNRSFTTKDGKKISLNTLPLKCENKKMVWKQK